MISIKRYDEERKHEWDSFNQNSKNFLFMFDRNYMDYHKDRFKDHLLMFYDDEKLIALLPMSENERSLVSFICCKKNDEMIAGTVIYEYNSVVHTHYMAANDEARTIGALDLVIATVIKKYLNNKKWLDFYYNEYVCVKN